MRRPKNLFASNIGYGRTFYADEQEDLAYLKKLAKDTRGDENRWPELNLRIYGRPKGGEGMYVKENNARRYGKSVGNTHQGI
jgi:hypothetical protein